MQATKLLNKNVHITLIRFVAGFKERQLQLRDRDVKQLSHNEGRHYQQRNVRSACQFPETLLVSTLLTSALI